MVDPNNITNYSLSHYALQELIIFWICVAGKTASTISKALQRFFGKLHKEYGIKCPFDLVKNLDIQDLAYRLQESGIGCQNSKARSIREIANSGLDLRTCSVEDLMEIHGIGPKTSRCFILHSRKNADCAGLDTHILHFLRDLGYDVPKSTPGSKKKYTEIEHLFIDIVKQTNRTIADLDLLIWRVYSQHQHLKSKLLRYFERRKNGIFESTNC